MTYKIVVLDPISEERADRMRALLPAGFELSHATNRGDSHLKEVIAGADFAISGMVAVNGDVLRAAKNLKLLHKWGVGYDNFDIATAKELGIKVARTTASNALPVAEFALGLTLSTLRYLSYGHAELKKGNWITGRIPGDTYTLTGKTVGIVGLGAIGQAFASLLKGFGCTVIYTNEQSLAADREAELRARRVSLPELLSESDVISLHCPLTPETRHLMNADAFRAMKRSAVLINAARGGIVDEAALANALRNREIAGAAMDVFATEPLPADSELLKLDNLVVTPHLASNASDNFRPTVERIYRNILLCSRGEAVPAYDSVI